MLIPLLVLSVGAVSSGMIFYNSFVGAGANDFFQSAVFNNENNHVLHDYHYVSPWVKVSPFIAMAAGFFLALYFYVFNKTIAAKLSNQHSGLYQFLLNKWYFDEFFNLIIIKPALRLGDIFWRWGDGRLIDGFINRVALDLIPRLTNFYAKLQSGFLFHYAFGMIIGTTLLITWFSFP